MEARGNELRAAIGAERAQAHEPLREWAASEDIAAARDGEAAIRAYGDAVARHDCAAECADLARAAGTPMPFDNGADTQLAHRYPTSPFPPELRRILRPAREVAAIWGKVEGTHQ
jgi:hypothetical protein